MSRVNLKLLQTFLLVAEHSSFRHAADKVHRSQSAVSTQIKQLEDQLGVTLFHRTTRNVRLTAEGEQLLDCARRAVHEVEAGLRRINEAADIRRGRVAISCSPTVAATRLPTVLAAFAKDYPGVNLFVRELTSDDLFGTIRQRECDFGIGPLVSTPELNFEPILEEHMYALVPKSLLRRSRATITVAELATMPLLVLNPATALRALVEETLKSRNLKLARNYQFSQAQTLIAAARVGLGAAILPEMALPAHAEPEMQVLRIVEPVMKRQVAIVTLKGQSLSPAATRLAQLVRELVGSGSWPAAA